MKKKFLTGAGVVVLGITSAAASTSGMLSVEHVAQNASLERVEGEFLVTLRSANVESANVMSELGTLGVQVVKRYRSSPTVLVRLPDGESSIRSQSILNVLARHPDIERVEANTIIKAFVLPNDDKFDEQYALSNSGQTGGTAGADIKAGEAWNQTVGSKEILVGVIDTGIDHRHEDLSENIWTNPGESGTDAQGRDKKSNGVDDDNNGFIDDFRGWDFVSDDNDPMDDQGHGTHTAGTIGATGNNSIGVAGVAWTVSLVGIKFLDASGSGSLADAVEAIEYGTTIGVNLTSNSWGGGGFSATMEAAIREADQKGILFIAAAGNESNNNDNSATYPATYQIDNVISVAATDHKDILAYFSNFGRKTVHLAAPGVAVLSTVPGNKYEKLSGTSMACPHVSGAAALIWSLMPDLTHRQVKARLVNNVQAVSSVQDRTIGAGRLSLPAALEQDFAMPGQAGQVQVKDMGLFSVGIEWGVTGDDGSTGRASNYEIRFIQQTDSSNIPGGWDDSRVMGYVKDIPGQSKLSFTLENLPENFKGFVSVRAIDNVGNSGDLSAPTFVQLAERNILKTIDADSQNEVEFGGNWGTESDTNYGLVFSDSPQGSYGNSAESSMRIPRVEGDFSRETYLTFFSRHELETLFDYGYVEARKAGSNEPWTELAKYNGTSEWKKEVIRLPQRLNNARALEFRFRLKADASISLDGWYLDSISLVQKP